MFYLVVMYLDHVDFSHRQVYDSFPRIEVWKHNLIRHFSDPDLKSPSVYGMRPLLDFQKTCYFKAVTAQLGAEPSDDLPLLSKLEEVCGCDVPDILKASVVSLIEDHCKSCVSPIPDDLLKSRDLVLKVLKLFVDYDNSSDHPVASPMKPTSSDPDNVVVGSHVFQSNVDKVVGGSSSAKDPTVSSSVLKKVRLSSDVPRKDISQPYDVSSKSVRRGDDVPKGSHQTVHSHPVGDVIPVGKDNDTDSEVDIVLSADHYIGATIVMQTLPFSDDESPLLTPNLSKKLRPKPQLHSSSKPGCSVAAPVILSSPEVAIVGSMSLSQKLRSMGKKSEVVYNSKLQNSSSGLLTSKKSLSKIHGYPSVSPNQFAGSSGKSDSKVSNSSTGGKVPLHGPRRNVKPNRFYSDEFEIERGKFKVNDSQIKNYKAICNLTMSPNSGDDAIFLVEFGALFGLLENL
ncbi:unnamed protein product [Miscanthus lutarioriparius]|uniref:Uncharacterized protein n=1 Tax=Miscanthus lutarioriparius TaxID=422564 RepID=A0A811QNM2_9POAL|nr:unnamed protein product [Miscanthus lutarioriparius]